MRRDRLRVERALEPLGLGIRDSHDPVVIVVGGAAWIEKVRGAHPSALILALLGPGEDAALMLDQGADGVLRGLDRPAELRARVRALIRRADNSVGGESIGAVGV